MAARNWNAVRQRPGITRVHIVTAAMAVLQRDGYDALTIRNVATELGVKSASLYWHFRTKEELEDLLADEVLSDFKLPPPRDDWRDELRDSSLRLFKHLLSKRDASRLRAGRLLTGPNTLRWMERGLQTFRRAGLDNRGVAYASHAVHVYIQGFVTFASSRLSATQADGATPGEILNSTRATFASLPADIYPNIVALAEPLTEGDRDRRFLFGLDCLIAGIDQLARQRRRPGLRRARAMRPRGQQ